MITTNRHVGRLASSYVPVGVRQYHQLLSPQSIKKRLALTALLIAAGRRGRGMRDARVKETRDAAQGADTLYYHDVVVCRMVSMRFRYGALLI